MIKPTLLILAAGIGSRFGGLKQLEPVGPSGEAIIEYSVYDAMRAGFGKVVFVIKKEMESDFKEFVYKRFDHKIEINLVFQEIDMLPRGYTPPPERKKPWGTAHAILAAKKAVNTPFAVINADDFYGQEAYERMKNFFDKESSETVYGMIGYMLKNTLSAHGAVSRGICETDDKHFLKSITERTKIIRENSGIVYYENGVSGMLSGGAIVSMNIWGFTPSVFQQIEETFSTFLDQYINDPDAEFYTPSLIDQLIRSKSARVKILKCNSSWFGITFREDRELVRASILEMVNSGVYPGDLWE